MKIKMAISIIGCALSTLLIPPTSLNALTQEVRKPLTCPSRTAPTKGAPSLEQVRRYFTCDNESGDNNYPGITSVLLIDDLNIEVSPRGRRPNARDVMYETIKGVRIEMAPDRLVYDIRGTYTNYFCRSGGYFQPGKNCRVDKYTGSMGICYQSNFGEWHCLMYGDIKPVGDKLPPPSGSSASAPPEREKPENIPKNSPPSITRAVVPTNKAKYERFFEWCKAKKSLPVATKHTIDVMLKEAGTSDCFRADSQLNNVIKLTLINKQIVDLTPLTSLKNLSEIFLGSNKISDLSPLALMTNLKTINLNTNHIKDVKPLAALTNLKDLTLAYNKISDLTPLSSMNNLQAINLSSNQISDLNPLASITSLGGLNLSINRISDVKPLAGLTNLTSLDLYTNKISDVKSLAGLTKLSRLELFQNKISDKTCPVKPASICSF